MANRRFIDFPIATTVGDSDIILIWQSGVNKQTTKATFLSGLPENLDELNDVAISGLTNGQILRYDSVTGKWENTDQGNLDLNDLNDVSIVSPSNGQVLVYNSSTSKWENSSGGFVPYTGAVTTVNLGAQIIQAGQFVKAGGTASQFLKADGSIDSTAYGTGSVTSVGLTMPSAFSVANSPVTTAGTLAVTGAGTVSQYIRGDGSLADFPESSGGGSSVSYYLNGSVNQGTIGGVAYRELSKIPVLGAGTDFSINANGYVASFITDAGDPSLLEIPGGNWNFETYFSASSGGGSPTFYVELYKVNSGGTATLIASSSSAPELIAFGTNITAYFSSLAVPTTTLALTDRLAVRYYVTHSGRTITMHTENNHLCQIITTFTTGLTALNGLTAQVQNFATGTTGTDFNIASATATHTFNLPTASATNRGALSSGDWTIFNNKQNALTNPVTGTGSAGRVAYWNGAGTITSDSLFQWNDFSKRLGIGRTPTVSLDVEGAGFFSGTVTASSIIKSGGTSSQYLMADGSVSTLTNPVTGTGTTNYLPKFTGTSTIGNSIVFDNGTNVGINTTSPFTATNQTRLSINGSVISGINLYANNVNTAFYAASASGLSFGTITNIPISIFTNDTVRMTLTSNGNLGLGVTPSAWDSVNTRAFQLDGGSVYMYGGDRVFLGQNIFFGALGDTYVKSNFATTYRQYNGTHAWYNAPSGTAGNAISFTQAMTLTSGGNLLVGTTTDNGARLQVSGNGSFTPSASSSFPTVMLHQGSGGGSYGHIAGAGDSSHGIIMRGFPANGSTSDYSVTTGDVMSFYEFGGEFRWYQKNGTLTERMRINSAGNVLINTTSNTGAINADAFRSNLVLGAANSNKISFNNGSTTETGFVYNDSSETAIGYPSAGTFKIQRVGVGSVVTVNSSGNVGIGTTSPDSQLTLNGSSNSRLNMRAGDTRYGTLYADNGVFAVASITAIPLVLGTNDIERMRITSSGNVLIGTATDSGQRLQVSGTSKFNNNMDIGTSSTNNILMYAAGSNNPSVGVYGGAGSNSANGAASLNVVDFTNNKYWQIQIDASSQLATFYYNGSVWSKVGYQTTGGTWTNSDERRKENIEISKYGLNEVLQLIPKKFNYKLDERKIKNLGFIAQDVINLIPESVQTDIDGQKEYYAMNYSNLVPVLVKAIQELKQEIDNLKN